MAKKTSQNKNTRHNKNTTHNENHSESRNEAVSASMPKATTIHHCIYFKNKNGLGGVAIDTTTQDKILIEKNVENFALERDEVEVKSWLDNLDTRYGSIQKIIKHNTTNLVGTISLHKNKPLLHVSEPKFGNYVVKINPDINSEAIATADKMALFNVAIVSYPSRESPCFDGIVVNSIGTIDEADTFITKCIIESNLPVEFSSEALKQADSIPDTIANTDEKNRNDLRELFFVTIDGADAKDFDDAVYCEFNNNVFTLFVAIADVAHYVTQGSPLDNDAYLRSTSVYFPRQVIPMLPERLSNGLCSLNPHVDRLTMCAEIRIDLDGNFLDYKIHNAIINSKARLTYSQVQNWLDDMSLVPTNLNSNISNLHLVFQALLKARKSRGAIDFESEEPKFEFAEDGTVTGIIPFNRLDAHKLIEECMLAANVCVADFLIKHNHPGLFRIHEKPNPEKFVSLKNYLNSLAVELDVRYEDLSPHDYANLLVSVHDHADFSTIQQATLRSMQLAVYSPNNVGHFGLSYDKYMHFTSPIRRYPDLLTHRACKAILLNQHYTPLYPLSSMGEHTSLAERRSEDLERKMHAFYKCQFAKSHIGAEFKGIITSVTKFGLFVYLPELMLDGLVHITELGEDYFIFDDKKQALTGKNTGVAYHNGQIIQTQIGGVDMAQLFIDLNLV
jgi:ribonuclease R